MRVSYFGAEGSGVLNLTAVKVPLGIRKSTCSRSFALTWRFMGSYKGEGSNRNAERGQIQTQERVKSKRQKGSNANAFLSVQYYLQGVCLASMVSLVSMVSMVSMACMVSWVSVVSMVSMAFLFLDLGFYGLHGCHGFLGVYGFHAFRGFHGFLGFYGSLGFHRLCGFHGFLGVHGFCSLYGFPGFLGFCGFYAFHDSFLRSFYIHGFFRFHDFHTCGCEITPSIRSK